ncbi:MAG TPA: GAF domain-containing protein, partial [Candidatus Methylomirabilis sp.]|nr:GAF domain-containing protein [Candidatus Methylomirabilis sp.]
ITPVRAERGDITHFIAIKQDITERKRAEEELRRVNRALSVLSDCNQALVRASEESKLLNDICRIIVEVGGYRMAWVCYAEQDEGKTVRPVAYTGCEEGYLQSLAITWADTERGGGPTGTAIRTGKPCIANNTLTDPAFAPWRAEAAKRGYGSSIALPLRAEGQPIGALNIYAAEPDAFSSEEEVKRLTELAGDLEYGIVALRTRALRQRAEEALRQGEERYRDLVENANDIIYTHDMAGNFTSLNRAGERISGYTRDETFTMNLAQVIAPEHLDLARQMIAHKVKEGGPTAYELDLIAKDGHRVPLEVSTRLIYKDGSPIGIQGIARDITERKQAEATRQALYRASLEIQEPLGLQDRLDRLLQASQAILELERVNVLLADSEERWLQAVASFGTEEPLATIRVPIGPEGGAVAEAYRTRQVIVWDGGGPVPALLRLQPPYDQIAALRSRAFVIVPLVVHGRSVGVLGADRKQSRRPLDAATGEVLQLFAAQAALAIEQARLYEAQEMAAAQLEATVESRTRELQASNAQLQEATHQAQSASRHKSAFLANMSHELRTPLNAILGFSELLAQQTYGPLTQKQARYVDNVHTSGQHLLALINDLLDLSKVEAGKLELHPQAFHLREALEAALHVLRPQAEAKQQALRLQVADDVSTLMADPLRVRQILYNLLSNGVKFTPEGGSITVTAKMVSSSEFAVSSSQPETRNPKPETASASEFVEIAVADTGIGIKPDDLAKLFQPFTQLEPTFTKQAQGTGLGLALTKRLVELHGGTIWAESAGEGRGSTFTIRLPLRSPAS